MSPQDTDLPVDELATLKARADMLGVKYHPSISIDKLREKVNAAVAGEPKEDVPVAKAAVESANAKRKRIYDEAMKLVRVRITCMNPAKKEWEGEIIAVGNSVIPEIKRFVPFNAEDGWHIEQFLLNVLKERQCQIFISKKSKNGVTIREGKLIREFAIEILDPLTPEELHDLAQRQAMAKSVD